MKEGFLPSEYRDWWGSIGKNSRCLFAEALQIDLTEICESTKILQ